jgi:transcription elongation factor SPT6
MTRSRQGSDARNTRGVGSVVSSALSVACLLILTSYCAGDDEEDIGALDEDDLELLEQNTGRRLDRTGVCSLVCFSHAQALSSDALEQPRLKRLKRHRSRSSSRASDAIDEEDLGDGLGDNLPDIHHIFDDDRGENAARRVLAEEDDDEMEDFIELDEEERAARIERERRRKEAGKDRIQRTAGAGFKGFDREWVASLPLLSNLRL